MVEPDRNGKNPLVQSAQVLRLPMPGEIEDEDDEDDEYEDEWEERPDVDSEPLRMPQSEDEQFNGVNRRVAGEQDGQPRKKKRRRPPMPKVPKPEEGEVFDPPFTVLPDGTVVGPRVGEGLDELPEGFDPPRGSAEASVQLLYGRPPQRSGGV